jgi:hypothetical protein
VSGRRFWYGLVLGSLGVGSVAACLWVYVLVPSLLALAGR